MCSVFFCSAYFCTNEGKKRSAQAHFTLWMHRQEELDFFDDDDSKMQEFFSWTRSVSRKLNEVYRDSTRVPSAKMLACLFRNNIKCKDVFRSALRAHNFQLAREVLKQITQKDVDTDTTRHEHKHKDEDEDEDSDEEDDDDDWCKLAVESGMPLDMIRDVFALRRPDPSTVFASCRRADFDICRLTCSYFTNEQLQDMRENGREILCATIAMIAANAKDAAVSVELVAYLLSRGLFTSWAWIKSAACDRCDILEVMFQYVTDVDAEVVDRDENDEKTNEKNDDNNEEENADMCTYSALKMAVKSGCYRSAEWLIAHGADPKKPKHGAAFGMAVHNADVRMIDILVTARPQSGPLTSYQRYEMLVIALAHDRCDVIKAIVQQEDMPDEMLEAAVVGRKCVNIVPWLLNEWQFSSSIKSKALKRALEIGPTQILRTLIEAHAQIDRHAMYALQQENQWHMRELQTSGHQSHDPRPNTDVIGHLFEDVLTPTESTPLLCAFWFEILRNNGDFSPLRILYRRFFKWHQ